MRSIICLLGNDQLPLYAEALPEGLLGRYRASGFEVAHLGVSDGLTEPYTEEQLDEVVQSFRRLPKPVLVHCSAGLRPHGTSGAAHPGAAGGGGVARELRAAS